LVETILERKERYKERFMIIDRTPRKYLELALEEESLEVAKEIFALARRCHELVVKNRRLKQLSDRVQLMINSDDLDGLTPTTQMPRNWNRGFETGFVSYLRCVAARSVQNYESRRKLERGADDILFLEVRNRAMRRQLDNIASLYSGDERFSPWVDDYESEKRRQSECECCGMGCHTCPTCRKYFDLAEGLRQERASAEVATQVA
jgi:hypothetical protein